MALKLVNIRIYSISLQNYKDKAYKHFRAYFIQKNNNCITVLGYKLYEFLFSWKIFYFCDYIPTFNTEIRQIQSCSVCFVSFLFLSLNLQ